MESNIVAPGAFVRWLCIVASLFYKIALRLVCTWYAQSLLALGINIDMSENFVGEKGMTEKSEESNERFK